jgi:hypothetical protein
LAYERYGLGEDATAEDFFTARNRRKTVPAQNPKAFEGFAAVLSVAGSRIQRIRLLPIDLQFKGSPDRRGRPQIATPAMGRRILKRVAARSRRYGTKFHYDELVV